MRVICDTSIWIQHFRKTDDLLVKLLKRDLVCVHPMIVGELACGNLPQRQRFLQNMDSLPTTIDVSVDEAMHFLEAKYLYGKGLGWVDIHILCSAFMTDVKVYTHDKSLQSCARSLKLHFVASILKD